MEKVVFPESEDSPNQDSVKFNEVSGMDQTSRTLINGNISEPEIVPSREKSEPQTFTNNTPESAKTKVGDNLSPMDEFTSFTNRQIQQWQGYLKHLEI